MEWDGSNLVFKSGRRFYANFYVGIGQQDDGTIGIAQGYDGHVDLADKDGQWEDVNEMTSEEKTELADYMISVWTKFKS